MENKKIERPLASVMNTARELMQLHGLQGWNFKFDHARRRAGQCDFTNQTISLSRHYARLANDEHIRDTILHEIAHALVGPSHGHNNIWRSMAMRIGCTAMRCHNLNFFKSRWLMTCPSRCFFVERHRRLSGLVCASCKSPVMYIKNERY